MKIALLLLVALALCAPLNAQTSVAAAQKEAIRCFPDLGKAGTPLQQRFVAEYNRLKAAGDPLLNKADWPLKLASRCAEDLGITASDIPGLGLAQPQPQIASQPVEAQASAIKPAPHFAPTALDGSNSSLTGGLANEQTGRKAMIVGKVLSVDEDSDTVIVYAEKTAAFGMDQADGAVAIIGSGLSSRLSDDDTVNVTGREAGFYKYQAVTGAAKRVRAYKFEGGYFRDKNGRNIK